MNIIKRITLSQFLPQKGNFESLIITKSIDKKIQITVEEVEEFNIKSTEQGYLTMNEKAASYIKEIEFTQLELDFIIKQLNQAKDNSEELTMQFIDLYEEFIK